MNKVIGIFSKIAYTSYWLDPTVALENFYLQYETFAYFHNILIKKMYYVI